MEKIRVPEQRRIAVSISLNLGLLARIDEQAERTGVNRSELVRQFIEAGLQG